ncbi:MAG: hypothetical protein O3A46_12440 [Candidatus Poribacteria bacterium]|nr:hypothetical protein [Candidatus Poribacteria bacterium]
MRRMVQTMSFALVSMIPLLICCSKAEERKGIPYRPSISPDGKHLVFVVEQRMSDDATYDLTLLTDRGEAGRFTTIYSLTPDVLEIINSSGGNYLAYLAYDITTSYGIYYYRPDQEVAFGVNWSSSWTRRSNLQFSTDQQYLRFLEKPSGVFTSESWHYVTNRGRDIFPNEPEPQGPWATPLEPTSVPDFLSSPQPEITQNTSVAWAGSAEYVLTADSSGIWRCRVIPLFQPKWDMLVQNENIRSFDVSRDGTKIVYEFADHDNNEGLSTIELYDDQQHTITKIGQGWDPIFHMNDQSIFIGNLEGIHEFDLNGKRVRTWADGVFRP